MSTHEVVLTLCQPFQSNLETLSTQENSCVLNKFACVDTKNKGAFVRVATDLENLEKSGNLKETSKSQGICLKSQGI